MAHNYQEAAAWYRRAAEQGDAVAQWSLGLMYANGRGVAQNHTEAIAWYRLAAEQGHTVAQYSLDAMSNNGNDVVQGDSAVAPLRRIAEQGNAYAQFELGVMYSNGEGVSRNPVIAYVLENLAAAQGHEDARYNRDIILKTLTSDQITEGQRLASEWQVGTPLPTSSDVTTWP